MRDYAELVKALRHCAVSGRSGCAADCKYGKEHPFGYECMDYMFTDAADAIEELLADNTEAFSADIISMQNAVETDVWLMVWAAEPNRKIHVQMTYDELWKIVQTERENMIEPPKEVE